VFDLQAAGETEKHLDFVVVAFVPEKQSKVRFAATTTYPSQFLCGGVNHPPAVNNNFLVDEGK
jgi:hypothetical protein